MALSDSEIENMVKEAEGNREQDQQTRQNIDNKNKMESLIYQAEKTINEHGDKVDEAELSEIKNEIESAKTLIQGEDHEQIAERIDDFEKKIQEAVAKMYQQAMQEAAQNATAPEQPQGESDPEIVDAEVEDA